MQSSDQNASTVRKTAPPRLGDAVLLFGAVIFFAPILMMALYMLLMGHSAMPAINAATTAFTPPKGSAPLPIGYAHSFSFLMTLEIYAFGPAGMLTVLVGMALRRRHRFLE